MSLLETGDADRRDGAAWLRHMRRGEFRQAWRVSDSIRARGAADPHRFWQGEAVDGQRVMLRSLHGFGDAVQGLRFVPALRARAARLTLEVAPALLELARCVPGPDAVIAWGADAPNASLKYDVQVEVTELAYLLRATAETLPPPVRFALPPELLAQAGAVLETRPAVGLVWSPGAWDLTRAVPWELLAAATEGLGCALWNLQGGPVRAQAAGRFCDAPALCDGGLLPMAAMLARLDLVITVDTLAAHLAASLGTPTWVLLQQEADWRWMVDRRDSPWYPTMRLYRNQRQDGWAETLGRVRAELGRFCKSFAGSGVLHA